MAKDEELEKDEHAEDAESGAEAEERSPEAAEETEQAGSGEEESEAGEQTQETEGDAGESVAPTQLGHKRFVYAAYLAGGLAAAFVAAKVLDLAWLRLEAWKPAFGEPKDEITAPVGAVIGALVAWRYWRDQKIRKLAEETAEELTKVTWPTRKEVTNSTTVVIVATAFATVFFFLMDKFWSFVTNLVYGS